MDLWIFFYVILFECEVKIVLGHICVVVSLYRLCDVNRPLLLPFVAVVVVVVWQTLISALQYPIAR